MLYSQDIAVYRALNNDEKIRTKPSYDTLRSKSRLVTHKLRQFFRVRFAAP